MPLFDQLKLELKNMVSNGIISKVTEATEWCAPIVVASKKSGAIRVCGDYTELNKGIICERLILPTTEECLAKICRGFFFFFFL